MEDCSSCCSTSWCRGRWWQLRQQSRAGTVRDNQQQLLLWYLVCTQQSMLQDLWRGSTNLNAFIIKWTFQIHAIKDKQQRCFLTKHAAWVANTMQNIWALRFCHCEIQDLIFRSWQKRIVFQLVLSEMPLWFRIRSPWTIDLSFVV